MRKVFLSYAIEDGSEAAARLRFDLTRAGLSVWQDIAEMRGGHPWKEQLRSALREVDTVLVLLTPKAVESKYVTWEWENALTLQKRVIPLMIRSCSPPPDLSRLHYYRFEQPDRYVSEFAALLRDLYELPAPPAGPAPEPVAAGSTFTVGTAINSAVGNNPVVINQSGPAPAPEQKRTPIPGAPQKKPSQPK
jgi:hypothetical protein